MCLSYRLNIGANVGKRLPLHESHQEKEDDGIQEGANSHAVNEPLG